MSEIKVNLQTQEGIRETLSKTAKLLVKGEIKAQEASVISKMCETAIKSIEGESWVDDIKI